MEMTNEVSVNQEGTDVRGQLIDRMKSRYPDRDYFGQDGQDSPNSLEESILQALVEDETKINDYEGKQKVYEENTGKLTKLFVNSARAAVFLNTLATTGNPVAAIIEAYGKDVLKAFMDGDPSGLITQIEQEDAERKAADEQWLAQKEANIRASIEALDVWGDEKGLDDEKKADVFKRAIDIASDAGEGKYSREFYEMIFKADNYDNDVATARHEGEIAGRNANIQAQQRKRAAQASMPPQLSGQGVGVVDNQTPRKKSFWEE